MKQTVLIAEPCEVRRLGIRAVLVKDPYVSAIREVATSESLQIQLRSNAWDLVVINQSLQVNISLLPRGNFAILTAKPDMAMLRTVYEQGACGYLSENISAELLHMLLSRAENSFLIEPALTPWIMECLFSDAFTFLNEEQLTPREKEIIGLLREGLDRRTIARHLCITDNTLKTHIKNISRKRENNKNAKNHAETLRVIRPGLMLPQIVTSDMKSQNQDNLARLSHAERSLR